MNRAAMFLRVASSRSKKLMMSGPSQFWVTPMNVFIRVSCRFEIEVVLRAVAVERVVTGPRARRRDDVVLGVLVHAEGEELHAARGRSSRSGGPWCWGRCRARSTSRAGATSAARGRGSCRPPSIGTARFWWYISRMSVTLSLAVAKWPCQKSVSFSWSGVAVVAMRSSHQCWSWYSFSQSPRSPSVRNPGWTSAGARGEVEELVDGRRPGLARQRRDLGCRAAEAGSAEEVRDVGGIWHWRCRSGFPRRGLHRTIAARFLSVPEGDTIFRAAARLRDALVGKELVELEVRRDPRGGADRSRARRSPRSTPTGKHLLVHFDDGHVLHTHMQMTGAWQVYPTPSTRWRRPGHTRASCSASPTAPPPCASARRSSSCDGSATNVSHVQHACSMTSARICVRRTSTSKPSSRGSPAAAARPRARHGAPRPTGRGRSRQRLQVRSVLGRAGLAVRPDRCARRRDPTTDLRDRPPPAHEQPRYRQAHHLWTRPRGVRTGAAAVSRCRATIVSRRDESARTTYWCPRCQPEPAPNPELASENRKMSGSVTQVRKGVRPLVTSAGEASPSAERVRAGTLTEELGDALLDEPSGAGRRRCEERRVPVDRGPAVGRALQHDLTDVVADGQTRQRRVSAVAAPVRARALVVGRSCARGTRGSALGLRAAGHGAPSSNVSIGLHAGQVVPSASRP